MKFLYIRKHECTRSRGVGDSFLADGVSILPLGKFKIIYCVTNFVIIYLQFNYKVFEPESFVLEPENLMRIVKEVMQCSALWGFFLKIV